LPNKAYLKGVRKERKLVNKARANKLLAFRSAGSHSPIDVVIIDKYHRKVRFIQCKPDDMAQSEKERLLNELFWLAGNFKVTFEII